jgi:hypothetical protein
MVCQSCARLSKVAASNSLVYTIAMARGIPITEEEKETIAAALEKKPNATLVARTTGWSFATVWRVAEWASIELTAGRQAKGYKRLSAARRRKIAAALRVQQVCRRQVGQTKIFPPNRFVLPAMPVDHVGQYPPGLLFSGALFQTGRDVCNQL